MNPLKSLVEYFRSAKLELEKVSWPSRQDTIRYSSLVLGISVVVAVFFATLDFGLNRLVDAALQGRSAGTEDVQTPIDTAPVPATVPGLDIQGGDATVVPTPTP